MDPIVSSIVAAVTAGAVAAGKDVASSAVKDAYGGLKQILTDAYKATFFPGLEKNPTSQSIEGYAAEEIANSDAAKDEKVKKAAEKLLDEIERDTALHSALEKVGTVIRDLRAKRSIIIEQIDSSGGTLVENLTAEDGDINLGKITSGSGGK